MKPLQMRLVSKEVETAEISRFEFEQVNGGELPAFDAGAHADFHLSKGLVRSYSLCGDPQNRQRYSFGVLRDPHSRGGSLAMHRLQVGQTLEISHPKNHFPLTDAADSLLLAGGIGVTPMMSMAQVLHGRGQKFHLHYAARSRTSAAFVPWLKSMPFSEQVSLHFDDEAPDQRLDFFSVLSIPASDKHVYVCGPQGFIDAALTAARTLGWSEHQLHFELFGAKVREQAGDQAFTVVLEKSGQKFWIPVDKTVVQVLHEAGIDLPVACEQGVCGTCLTHVTEGVPDHRDHYLTPEEQAANDQFLPCCSRSHTAILSIDR